MKALALGAVLALGGIAAADPDPIAQTTAEDANLESNAPRQGVTFSASLGGGLLIANGGVEEIPVFSLRLGHVATSTTVVTLEVTGGTYQHKPSTTQTVVDGTGTLLVGAQHYFAPSVWIRGGGGLNLHTVDNGMARDVRPGPAGLFGAGVDLVVRHFWRLGLEGYGVAAVERGGLLFTSMLGIGLSHY